MQSNQEDKVSNDMDDQAIEPGDQNEKKGSSTEASEDVSSPLTLAQWVEKISQSDLPSVFSSMSDISSVAADERASTSELARVILHDPAITTKVLRVANSSYFNATGNAINTVSHAVVLLGFDTVRNITLSITMCNAFLDQDPPESLVAKTASSFHAAVQAKGLAQELKYDDPEAIFIASLLLQLGDLILLSLDADKITEIEDVAASQAEDLSLADAQRKVLGFTLNELALALAREWNLTGPLYDALLDENQNNMDVVVVNGSHELVSALEDKGWCGEAIFRVLEKLAKATKLDVQTLRHLTENSTKQAMQLAESIGSNMITDCINQVNEAKSTVEVAPEAAPIPEEAYEFYQPDLTVQYDVIEEMLLASRTRVDVNMIVQMALEGIQRGVGFDYAALAFLTPDKKHVRMKFQLSVSEQQRKQSIEFSVDGSESRLLRQVMRTKQLLFVGDEDEVACLRSSSFNAMMGDKPLMLGPMLVKQKVVGIFFADRRLSERPIAKTERRGFELFVNLANLCLAKT